MKTLFLSLIVTLLSPLIAQAQTFYNLDFEQTCDSSKTGLCHWDLSWGGKGACVPEKSGANQYLVITGAKEGAVGFTEQTGVFAQKHGLAVIEVTAKIKSDSIVGKGAGINVAIYDSADALLFTKDMGYGTFGWVHGTTDWKEYTVSAIYPAEAAKIKLGAILYGTGRALFDDYKVTITPTEGRTPSDLAIAYISAACDSIAMHSLVKDSINIDSLKTIALQIAGPAKTNAECHLAVQYLLGALRQSGDEHSLFMTPDDVTKWESDTSEAAGIHYAQSKIIDSCGYILVPPFHGGNPKLMKAYCDSIQTALQRLDTSNIMGWIIDLRENTGGNMTPMIAGLGPIFDSDKLGSLVDVNGHLESWFYSDGVYRWDNDTSMIVDSPIVLSKRRSIAVLISPQTGSSGEIVTLSFVGNGQTRLFGQPTWGLTTGNGSFDLPDSARMMLASTVMADRSGKLYHGSIEPDEKIEKSSDPNVDVDIEAAVRWIHGYK